MLLGILVASVAYQAGLEPPGGAWQSSREGYEAGHPVMHDNRRPQHLAFFYNSISFMASIVVIIMLLPQWLPNKEKESFSEEKKRRNHFQKKKRWDSLRKKKKDWEEWSLKVMNKTILLDLVALLGAYAAGSNRGWKPSVIP